MKGALFMSIRETVCPFENAGIGRSLQVKKNSTPIYPKTTSQCEDISREECKHPEDFQKLLLPYCRESNKRWADAYTKLAEDNPDVPWKTIKKCIISDIFKIEDPEERKNFVDSELGNDPIGEKKQSIYEQYFHTDKSICDFRMSSLLIGCMGASNRYGFFTRPSINSWADGSIPKSRNTVIKFAFWAHCTVEETNKLLECAGKHKLYLKGIGLNDFYHKDDKKDDKFHRASLQDIVYIFMLKNKNYSFIKAQEMIDILNEHFHDAIQKTMILNPDGSDTFHMQELFDKLDNERKELIKYFDNNIARLLYSYKTLYGDLVESFSNDYAISKGNQDNPVYSSIYFFTTSRLQIKSDNQTKKGKRNPNDNIWKESLKNTLYAAFSMNEDDKALMKEALKEENDKKKEITKQFKENQMKRIFKRNDIITLGLILNSSKEKINIMLGYAQEAPLYPRNFIENVIMNVADNPDAYSPISQIIEVLFTDEHEKHYGITQKELSNAMHAYMRLLTNASKHRTEICSLAAGITATLSLRKYEWIKSVSVVKEIYPKRKTEKIPFKCFLKETEKIEALSKGIRIAGSVFVIKCLLKYLPKKKEFQEKVIKESFIDLRTGKKTTYFISICYLKKLQVVRPIAFRYSRELLSYYPEKTLFDFLVEKTSSYLKDGKLYSYLKKENNS